MEWSLNIISWLARRPAATLHSLTTTAGTLVAAGLMVFLLWPSGKQGIPEPVKLAVPTFNVAVLSGPRELSQAANENIEQVVEAQPVAESALAPQVVTTETPSSLPSAVNTAPVPAVEAPAVVNPEPAEVIPPAQVSMPGGRLMAADADLGSATPDILSVSKHEVILRYLVDEQGRVVRGGIFRSGSDPLRDTFIHKAMKSQTYNVKELPSVQSGTEKLWMVELVVPYNKTSQEVVP